MSIKQTHQWHKSYDQIKEQCIQLGLTLSDSLYLKGQSDYVIVEGGGARAYYSSSNGHFFGTTDQGVEFDCFNATHDGEPWFQTLLDFFLWKREQVNPDEVPS